MTPNFAQAVDPIFLHVLDLLDRINRNEPVAPQDEKLRIRALLDQAEAMIRSREEWDLARYAIISWIDEMLTDADWVGKEWWKNNPLEVEIYSGREFFEKFYTKAQEAASLATRDALEVYYVCVVLGFRGLYQDPHRWAGTLSSLRLPADLATWAKQASMAIRLGQGRPQLATPGREVVGAPPLRTKSYVVWPWLVAVMLAAGTIVYTFYVRL